MIKIQTKSNKGLKKKNNLSHFLNKMKELLSKDIIIIYICRILILKIKIAFKINKKSNLRFKNKKANYLYIF